MDRLNKATTASQRLTEFERDVVKTADLITGAPVEDQNLGEGHSAPDEDLEVPPAQQELVPPALVSNQSPPADPAPPPEPAQVRPSADLPVVERPPEAGNLFMNGALGATRAHGMRNFKR